jgi:hypothetical protein
MRESPTRWLGFSYSGALINFLSAPDTDENQEDFQRRSNGHHRDWYDESHICFVGDPAINRSGTVAFRATLDTFEDVILSGKPGQFITIATSEGPRFSFFGVTGINNGGTVAFLGVLEEGGAGIFTGADPAADKVIQTGDALDGSTVTNVFASNKSLNNGGQLVFFAELEDGRQGIFRADPAP